MAPSRRKGSSKAAAAAAACRQWKVGDLVLAKVKGFPAWPATVSEPEKWGYSRDRKKVLVYFFGTQQIAFCNPVDVEAFTEEKRQSLFVKRRGKGADFVRAVHEIIDCFEKLKKDEQAGNCDTNDEVAVRSDSMVVELTKTDLEGEAPFTRESSSREHLGDESEQDFENSFVAAKEGASNDCEMMTVDPCSNVEVSHMPSMKTYSTRRKTEGGRSRNVDMERKAPSARRLRSSLRTDVEMLQNHALPSCAYSRNAGCGADTLMDRSARRRKRAGKPSDGLDMHNMELAAFVSNGSIEESDSEIATVDSGSLSLNEDSSVESGSKPEYRFGVQCESEIELSQRLEFRSSSVILKKKRKPNRKRFHADLAEFSTGMDKETAPETLVTRTAHVLLNDPVKYDEKNSKELKEDGDEHLPLVKRARVRMGRSATEGGEVLDNEVLHEVRSPGANDKSPEQIPREDGCQNSTSVNSDAYDSSPSKKSAAKKPPFWEMRKQFGSSLDEESALPPSKRLHRALEAMSAYAADDDKKDMDGFCRMKTSINGYCSISKEDNSETSPGTKFENDSDMGRMENLASAAEEDAAQFVATAKELAAREGLEQLSEMPDLATTVCDDSLGKLSCEDKNEVLDTAVQTPQRVKSSNDCPFSTSVAQSADANSDGGLQVNLKCDNPSPRPVISFDEKRENEVAELKHIEDPNSEVSGKSADCGSNEVVMTTSPVKGGIMQLGSAEDECVKNTESYHVSLDKSNQDDEECPNVKEATGANSSSSPEKAVGVSLKELHMSSLSSVSDDQLGDKAVSATLSSSSLTDGMDSFARASTPNTLTCNISAIDRSVLVSNGCSIPSPNQLHDKPRFVGKMSSRGEATAALGSFEAALGTLTRTKESISRATRVALDCAKFGVASKVVEIIARNLEKESSLHRRVDLFFLVDSIAQYSRGLKGHIGGLYPSTIQGVLPRLVSAAAPPGSGSQENRRQCLKVLRVWQERKILPESVLRPHVQELESFCGLSSSSRAFSRRPLRAERSFDDPVREMEGMLVDEYGSNSSFQLPGFRMPAMLKDEEASDSDGESFEAVTPEHPAAGVEANAEETIVEKRKHILEDVDGELEMEDVSPPMCQTEIASGIDHGNVLSYPPPPMDGPPSAPPLPASPPPPPPPPPLPQSLSTVSNSSSGALLSVFSEGSQNVAENFQETVFQQCTPPQIHPSIPDAIHCQTSESREIHVDVPVKVLGSASLCLPSNRPFSLSSGMHPLDGACSKGFHLRPPHPAPSNQFSYVQADQRRDIAAPYSNVFHMQNADNRSFCRDRDGMKSSQREIGECWRTPSHYPGPCYQDGTRDHYPYSGRHEPPPSHRLSYPPRGVNRREFFNHRPPPDRTIPVTSRGPGFWRPR